ncbi:MAG: TonB-dependent receptor [Desulfobacteraceae bacterium]
MRTIICLMIAMMAAVCNAEGKIDLLDTHRFNLHEMEVKGRITEKGTRRPLGDIAVYIRNVDTGQIASTVMTDRHGRFVVRLPAGRFKIIIAAMGYDKFEENIEIENAPIDNLMIRLIPKVINPYQMVVRQKKDRSEVSRQHISGQEANETAGSGRDVLTSIKNMPGISSVSVFNGIGDGLIIRGSAQEDSIISIGDHSIPRYYHFMGFEGIIEPELVESVDYIAGGFSPQYGDALGGVISLNLKDPRSDRFGGYANLSWLSTSFMLEGPLGKNDSFAFGMKRGFIDTYIRKIEDYDEDNENNIDYIEYPSYYDGTALFKHSISAGNQIKLIGIGSRDALTANQDDASVNERFSDRVEYKSGFASLIAEWEYKTGNLTSVLSPIVSSSDSFIDLGRRAYYQEVIQTYGLSEKIIYQAGPAHRLTGGVRLILDYADINANFFAMPKEGEISYDYYDREMRSKETLSLFYPAVFFMDQVKLGSVMVTPGINASYDAYNEHLLLDPRISLKYQLTPATALKGATGLYSKRPAIDESVAPWGTKGLKPEKSIHYILGVEHQFSDTIHLDLQGYYKQLDDMVVRIDGDDPSIYGNEGSGHVYGAELLIRHQMTDNFFGWLSYSYSVARRKDGPDEAERYFDNDMTHNLKAVVNYKPSRYWSLGLRYEYATGKPYTDLLNVETIYDVDNDEYRPIYDGSINEERFKPHHQLDLRIDKYWLFNHFILSTYLDVRNVLQNKNVTDIAYNKDYTDSEEILSTSSQVPLIFLGIKIDF